jgi:hypothetical protein
VLVQGDKDRPLRLQNRIGQRLRTDRRRLPQTQVLFYGLSGKLDEDFAILLGKHSSFRYCVIEFSIKDSREQLKMRRENCMQRKRG